MPLQVSWGSAPAEDYLTEEQNQQGTRGSKINRFSLEVEIKFKTISK